LAYLLTASSVIPCCFHGCVVVAETFYKQLTCQLQCLTLFDVQLMIMAGKFHHGRRKMDSLV